LHAGGDATGAKIEQALCEKVLKHKNIDIYEETMAVELLIAKDESCKGVVVYNTALNSYEAIYTNAVILASGGCGQVYKNTTNPPVATGDGIMLGISAGAKIENMEFIQFHPTALDVDKTGNKNLVSEAVRGEGAKLVNENGEMFMEKYDSRLELAPRDVVTRAVFEENGQIYLDISPIGIEKFKKRFPSISRICEENGIDLKGYRIPIAPAAHYCMGGVAAKTNGETTVKNLYAIGEVACTKLHGANRLASNSLLECVVCAWALSDELSYRNLDAPKSIDENVKRTLDLYEQDCETNDVDADGLILKLQDIMWKNVGIIRNREKLLDARMEILQIERIFKEKHKCQNRREYELRNLIEVAKTITTSALERKESVGAHFRSDDISKIQQNGKIQKDKFDDRIFIK
jgi:L-aspartate oxidase